MAHSKLSLSSAKRWMNCAGSIRLIAQAPPQQPSVYAAEGTAAHAVLESALLDWLGQNDRKVSEMPHLLGYKHTVEGFKFKTDGDMLEAVNVCIDLVKEIAEFYRLRPHQIKTEERLKIPGHDDLWGTSDIRLFVPYNRLIIIDYKHGKGVKVDANENEQLMAYAVGAFNQLTPDEQEEINLIEVIICQPRALGEPVSRYEFPKEILRAFHVAIVEAAVRTENPDAPLKAGEWCRFCPAKLFCGEYNNLAVNQANLDFAAIPAVTVEKVGKKSIEKIGLPDFREMSTEKLANILKAKKAIEQYLDDAEEYAASMARQGTVIPGFKLVESYGNRVYSNEVEVASQIESILGADAAYTWEILSPTQFEKAVATAFPGGIPAEARDAYTKVLSMVEKPYKGTVIAPESDKRPPAKAQALADFANVNPTANVDTAENDPLAGI